MKQLLLSMLVCATLAANEELKKHIDSIVAVISQERDTISKAKIVTLQDPFVKVEIQKDKEGKAQKVITQKKPTTPSYEKVKFTLAAIVNNQAKINNRWVEKGDMISGYKVEQIGTNFAKLNYRKFYQRTLYLNKADNNIINKGIRDEK